MATMATTVLEYGAVVHIKNLYGQLRISLAPPFVQNGAKSGFEMCFANGSQRLRCWGSQPTKTRLKSRHKKVFKSHFILFIL